MSGEEITINCVAIFCEIGKKGKGGARIIARKKVPLQGRQKREEKQLGKYYNT